VDVEMLQFERIVISAFEVNETEDGFSLIFINENKWPREGKRAIEIARAG
jgi:hypothetical protein